MSMTSFDLSLHRDRASRHSETSWPLRSWTTRSSTLRFCGKQVERDNKDVLVDVADNTTRTTYIDTAKNRKAEEKITPGEEKQLRGVVGSLSWLSRQASPDLPYRV